jgi:hypothetical protein
MRTLPVAAFTSLALVLSPTVATAQNDPSSIEIRSPAGAGIIRDPSEGVGPQTPGDPGGWQQLTLLAILLVGLTIIVLLVRRQIKQAQRLAEGRSS